MTLAGLRRGDDGESETEGEREMWRFIGTPP